jgi:hypothetical protein
MINGGQINDAQVNGFYAADEEAYQLWARDPSSACGHIVTLGYNGGSAVYPNWINYQLNLSDFPLPGYHEVIKSIPSFRREIGADFTGYVSGSLGSLVLDNTDGALDAWINLAFDGQRCLVTQGDPAWADPMQGNDPSRFRTVFECVAETASSADRGQITIQLRGADYVANVPIQTHLLPDTAGVNANSNQPVPLTFGTVFNLTPVLTDLANQVYQWNDGNNGEPAATPTLAYDGGVLFGATGLSISAVNPATNTLSTAAAHGGFAGTRVRFGAIGFPPAPLVRDVDYWMIAAGLTTTDFRLAATRGGSEIDITGSTTGGFFSIFHWTADQSTGLIYLDSVPAGQLTFSTLPFSKITADILPTVLGNARIDSRSLAKFAVTCPQQIGIHVPDRRNRLDVAGEIMKGLGAWFGASRYGALLFGRIEPAYASYDFALPQDYMDDDSFVLDHMVPPRKRHRLSYQKNYSDETGKLFAGTDPADRVAFSSPYRVTAPVLGADEGPADQEFHQLAVKPDVIETLMWDSAAAATEAARRDALFYGWGAVFRFNVGRVGAEIDVGSVLKVTHTRYGFAGGVNVPVISIDDNPTERKSTIKVFAALAAYAPGQI